MVPDPIIPAQRQQKHVQEVASEEDAPPSPSSASEFAGKAAEREFRALNEARNARAASGSPDRESDDHNLASSSEDEYHPEPIPSRIEHVRISQDFIKEIREATLENGKLDDDVIERLRNPDPGLPPQIDDPDVRLSIDIYLACVNASQETYNSIRAAIIHRFPGTELLSYYMAKKLVSDTTGIVSIVDDMCINSCHAFTGPFKDLENCTVCGEPRFTIINPGRREKRIPRQQAYTIPLGPQIQALRRSVRGASAMRYQEQKIQQVYDALEENIENPGGFLYDDLFCGNDILNLAEQMDLTADDTSVIFSFDGAQLYQNKKSDTWIAIWIVTNYDPKTRYRSKHVLPALIVPGPNKPKHLDSFLFRSFHHLSAIQREDNGAGIKVFDALRQDVVSSRTALLFVTGDTVALIEADGRVGHHGAHGCRKGCDFHGRHKPSSGHYFAAHLKPNNYSVEDCSHPDFDFRSFNFQLSPQEYEQNLAKVVGSVDQADYERNRKLTGISKPSLLSGLNPRYMLPLPLCFSVDLMHLVCLNIGELLIPLWRGTFKCEASDDKTTWDWAKLTGNVWLDHGKLVASSTKHFPPTFHRPPRNPAEKISSGYKATEFLLYLFGLGPGVFRTILPDKYWRNFCKLVRGVRIIMQRKISGTQAQEAHSFLVQFVEEYENMYYQRRVDRLHFTRPSLHSLLHTGPEIPRVGNGCLTSQFTMERTIGDLGRGIRQPGNPFGNLCQLAVRRAQINALKSIYSEFDNDPTRKLPRYSSNLGGGYIFLRPRDRIAQHFYRQELDAIGLVSDHETRQRWGRLQLPNGQIARSLYSESKRTAENKRNSRNVKVCLMIQRLHRVSQS